MDPNQDLRERAGQRATWSPRNTPVSINEATAYLGPISYPPHLQEIVVLQSEAKHKLSKAQSDLASVSSQRLHTPSPSLSQARQWDEHIQDLNFEIETLRSILEVSDTELNHYRTQCREKDSRLEYQVAQLAAQDRDIRNLRDISRLKELLENSQVSNRARRFQEEQSHKYLTFPPPPQLSLGHTHGRQTPVGWASMPGTTLNTPYQQTANLHNGRFATELQSNQPWNTPSPAYQQRRIHQHPSLGSSRELSDAILYSQLPPIGCQPSRFHALRNPASDSGSSGVQIPRAPTSTPLPVVRPDSVQSIQSNRSAPRSLKTAVIQFKASTLQAQLGAGFASFCDDVVKFCCTHLNVPNQMMDNQMQPAMKCRLTAAATNNTTYTLISNPRTRYLVMAKVILMWIEENVFRPSAFVGLDLEIDQDIRNFSTQLTQDPSATIGAHHHQALAQAFKNLKRNNQYQNFVADRVQKKTATLWSLIDIVRYDKLPDAWDSLRSLIRSAFWLAETMNIDPADYKFFYPTIHVHFNEAAMINMDEDFKQMGAADIMVKEGTVRLGAIPQVIRQETNNRGVRTTQTLCKAGVLLKFKEEHKSGR